MMLPETKPDYVYPVITTFEPDGSVECYFPDFDLAVCG